MAYSVSGRTLRLWDNLEVMHHVSLLCINILVNNKKHPLRSDDSYGSLSHGRFQVTFSSAVYIVVGLVLLIGKK